MAGPVPRCPLRPGEPCSLCQLNVTGPQDCGLVYLVMGDPDLRAGLAERRRARTAAARAADGQIGAEELGRDPRLEGMDWDG